MTPTEMKYQIKAVDRLLKQNRSKYYALKAELPSIENRVKAMLEEIRRDDFLILRTYQTFDWLSIDDYDVEEKIQKLRDGYTLEATDECDIYFAKTFDKVETEDEKQHRITRVYDKLQTDESEHTSLTAQIAALNSEHTVLSHRIETLRQSLKDYYKVTFGKK